MSEVQTHPKTAQLSRGPKRPARIKATRQEWATIRAAKHGPCRCYGIECAGRVELHHIVDPATGAPAVGPWRTISVAAETCVAANAAATAAIVVIAAGVVAVVL